MSQTLQILVSVLLASVPAVVWGYIFWKKDPVYAPKAILTFLVGMGSVVPMLIYKWSWDFIPGINIFEISSNFKTDILQFSPYLYLPLGTLFAFMFVGVVEEYLKHRVVVQVDRGFFRNIDDAIEFSIIAALGFAFIENILYFYYIWEFQGTEIVMISFVFRSVFSTFAHILFSGIYGYFYGLAYFADPVWSERSRNKQHPLINFMHSVFHLKRSRVFAVEKLHEGLFIAVILHAAFNIFLELNMTILMVPFLIFGYAHLNYLFHKKENLKAYGYLVGKDSPAHVHHVLWQKTRGLIKS